MNRVEITAEFERVPPGLPSEIVNKLFLPFQVALISGIVRAELRMEAGAPVAGLAVRAPSATGWLPRVPSLVLTRGARGGGEQLLLTVSKTRK